MPKLVNFKGLLLPNEFFLDKSQTDVPCSPASQFSPVAAIQGAKPWSNATSPAARPKPKALLITNETLAKQNFLELEMQCYTLHRRGFNFYVACNAKDNKTSPTWELLDLSNSDSLVIRNIFRRCRHFDEAFDWESLAKTYHLARDASCLLDAELISHLDSCLNKQQQLSRHHFVTLDGEGLQPLKTPIQIQKVLDADKRRTFQIGLKNKYRGIAKEIEENFKLREEVFQLVKNHHECLRQFEFACKSGATNDFFNNISKWQIDPFLKKIAEKQNEKEFGYKLNEICDKYTQDFDYRYEEREMLKEMLTTLEEVIDTVTAYENAPLTERQVCYDKFIDRLENVSIALEFYCSKTSIISPTLKDTQQVEALYLFVDSNVKYKKVKSLLLQGAYPNLAYVSLGGANVSRLQEIIDLLKGRPIRLLRIPKHSHTALNHIPYAHKFYSSNAQSQLFRSRESAVLTVATGGRSSIFSVNMNTNHYQYIKAGECLNVQHLGEQYVRKGVYRLRDLVSGDFSQTYFFPSRAELKVYPLNHLEEETLKSYRQQPLGPDGFCFFQFTQSLQPGLNRLLSIEVAEQFMGISQCSSQKLILYRSNKDGFYYIDNTYHQAKTIHFVIKARHYAKQQADYEQIPLQNTIRRVVDDYRNPNKGYKPCTTHVENLPKLDAYRSIAAWLEAMFEYRGGSCAHRVAAVEYKLKNTSDIDPEHIRVVDIDGDHNRLEVFCQNKWIQIDVGGSNNFTATYLSSQTVYQQPQERASQNLKTPAVKSQQALPNIDFCSAIEGEINIQNERLLALESKLKTHAKPKLLDTSDALNNTLSNPKYRHVLLIAQQREETKLYCLKRARLKNQSIYLIESQQDLSLLKQHIHLVKTAKGPQPKVDVSPLQRFFNRVEKLTDSAPVAQLFIDWQSFNAQEQVQLNTLLDDTRTLYGRPVPSQLQIITLCEKLPDDMSFLSRHDVMGDIQNNLMSEENGEQLAFKTKEIVIDFMKLDNWQASLFGPIVLNNNVITWQKSEWVDLLKAKDLSIKLTLTNLSEKQVAACQQFFARAKVRGYFEYHSYLIPYPTSLQWEVTESVFEFSAFDPITIYKGCTLETVPQAVKLINSTLFDCLLATKHIIEGVYYREAGWLQQASGKPLALWLTSALSETQWYVLFTEAQRLQVRLTVYLSEGIILPQGITTRVQTQIERLDDVVVQQTQILLTDNAQITQPTPNSNDPLIIWLEDMSYEDLVGEIIYEQCKKGFFNFTYQSTDFIEAIRANRPVELRGRCADELLQALHPLLARQVLRLPNGEILKTTSSLTLRLELEADELPSADQDYHPLAFLGRNFKVERNNIPNNLKNAPILHQEIQPDINCNIDLSDAFQKAKQFLQTRQAAVIEALKDARMIQLVGPTGVGKSRLIKDLDEGESSFNIHYGLENLAAWTTDSNAGDKILFLDESNIINQHLTFLAPLKYFEGACEIYYQGKSYTLSPQHKIIFARNPNDYGVGRQVQRLFADQSVPELHFAGFPDIVLYAVILAPLYNQFFSYDPLGLGNTYIDESTFRARAKEWLITYKASWHVAKTDHDKPTVRELQHQALCFLSDNARPQSSLKNLLFEERMNQERLQHSNYIALPSTGKACREIQCFIKLHYQQNQGAMPGGGLGLNGCYLEGPPGIGKSALLEHLLSLNGYQEKAQNNWINLWFDKLDASLSSEEKKQRLIAAFDAGQAVLIDELNACVEDGLEATLNNILTGLHPETGKSANKPGFMAFFTGNSIALSGRAALSPALLHRCQRIKFEKLSFEDVSCLLKEKFPQFKQLYKLDEFSKDFAHLTKEAGAQINLRFLLKNLSELLSSYTKLTSAFSSTESVTDYEGVKNPWSGCSIFQVSAGGLELKQLSRQQQPKPKPIENCSPLTTR